jgi:hypothetical protein
MIDWSKAPDWAQWAAIGDDGRTRFARRLAEIPARFKPYCRPDTNPQPEQGGTVSDMVSHPPHYRQGGIECIEAIEAALTPEEFRGYCKGNALKYVWRERHKGGDESLRKAMWYLARLAGDGND